MVSTVLRAATLVLVGGAVGVAVNGVRRDGLNVGAFVAASTCGAPATALLTLPPQQATHLCGDPGVVVADVRPAPRFAQGHVAGAIHLPCGSSADVVSRAVALLANKHTLILYGDTTGDATPVAESLRQRLPAPGPKVIVLDGGFPAWDRAGLACTSGPCPECKERASTP